jgi:hypothetical protein
VNEKVPVSTEADDAELAVMASITSAMKPLSEGQRQLVVDWFVKKYGAGHQATPSVPLRSEVGSTTSAGKTKAKKRRAAAAATPSANKPKGAPRPDKDLDLSPPGKTSFRDFVAEKRPSDNAYEHNVVALYWLTQVAELEKATTDQVFSCYRDAKWKLPADLRNSLQLTSTRKSWMQTNDADNLRITSQGINFVERDLPKTAAADA